VDALGEDQRSAYTLGAHMVLTENFNGNLCENAKDGKTYFIGGDADARIWEVSGLDAIRRQSCPVEVTEEQFARSKRNAEQNLKVVAAKTGRKMARVPVLAKAAADGNEAKWQGVSALPIELGEKRSATAQLGYDAKNLYVRFQVADESPLVNTPTDFRLLFKSGDSVEINLGTELRKRRMVAANKQETVAGDARIVIARTPEGKMVATRYRPVIAEKEKPNKASFETASSGKDAYDEVAAWDDLPMFSKVEKEGYAVEVAVPWVALGIAPKSGMTLIGDVGVIYGNEGGTRNAIRYLWSDKSPRSRSTTTSPPRRGCTRTTGDG